VTIAAILGMICFVFSLSSVIPSLVTDAFDMLSSTVAPLSMVVIGLRLASADFKHLLKDGEAYLSLLLRHLALPLLVLLALWAGKHLFPSLSDEACRVVLILASAPAASSVTMLSERYDCDATYAGSLVTVSTALSILTMPLCLLWCPRSSVILRF
jgi:predicted permease